MRKRKHARRRSSQHQHHELVGLALVFVGAFLAIPLWLGWDGGIVGAKIVSGLDGLVGSARLGVPLLLLVVGGLLVARSSLVDVRPFRTGLVFVVLGLMTILGEKRGGASGEALQLIFGRLLGETGTAALGLFALVAGSLLLTGASLGAILRRSAHAARQAAGRTREWVRVPLEDEPPTQPDAPPVDGEIVYPDIVNETPAPPPVLVHQLEDLDEPAPPEPSLFDPAST